MCHSVYLCLNLGISGVKVLHGVAQCFHLAVQQCKLCKLSIHIVVEHGCIRHLACAVIMRVVIAFVISIFDLHASRYWLQWSSIILCVLPPPPFPPTALQRPHATCVLVLAEKATRDTRKCAYAYAKRNKGRSILLHQLWFLSVRRVGCGLQE